MIKNIAICMLFTIGISSCVTVKEYEKMNINDPDMALTMKKCNKNLITSHSYREAASGGSGGKTGGGCGCN